MRILALSTTTLTLFIGACASAPKVGSLEGSATTPRIVAVDSTLPPRSVAVELTEPAYAALLLVAPGHSATLLYPSDSLVSNHLSTGRTTLSFRIPDNLVPTDSTGMLRRTRSPSDTSLRSTRREMPSMGGGPIRPDTPAFLLLVTSPQRLDYKRIHEKTTGVSLPAYDMEALNAVAKTIKGTITEEPRTWAGYYHQVELSKVH